MTDITKVLEERAVSYDQSGPSAQHTAELLRRAKAEIEGLRDELKSLTAALRDYQYSGGGDWAQMAADVDRGRGHD